MADEIAPSAYRKGSGIILMSTARDPDLNDEDSKLVWRTFLTMNVVPSEFFFSTKDDLEQLVKDIDLKDYEYCIVVMLSHGGSHNKIQIVNEKYDDIRRQFLKPLRKKIGAENKFFWIVSTGCRSQKTCTEGVHDDYDDEFLLEAFACQHGIKGYSAENGSLFIKFLCEVLKEHKMDYEVYDIVAETKTRLELFCKTHQLVEGDEPKKAKGASKLKKVQGSVQVVHTQKRVKFYFNAAKD